MWKLTITQKKRYELSEGTYDVELEFYNDNLNDLFLIIDNLTDCETVRETSYSITKAKESEA